MLKSASSNVCGAKSGRRRRWWSTVKKESQDEPSSSYLRGSLCWADMADHPNSDRSSRKLSRAIEVCLPYLGGQYPFSDSPFEFAHDGTPSSKWSTR